jgi:hypothetical protein
MRVIRASEVGEYVFCHRAWWLRHTRGLESANVRALAEGTAAHAGHGRRVALSAALRGLAVLVFVAALAALALALLPAP